MKCFAKINNNIHNLWTSDNKILPFGLLNGQVEERLWKDKEWSEGNGKYEDG